jgi:hypothetical protein
MKKKDPTLVSSLPEITGIRGCLPDLGAGDHYFAPARLVVVETFNNNSLLFSRSGFEACFSLRRQQQFITETDVFLSVAARR